MKKLHYFRVYDPGTYMHGRYDNHTKHYFRHFRTFNERKQNYWAELDGYKIRLKRNTVPEYWDDESFSQMYGRDWKRFTRRKHQYYGRSE